MSSCSTAQRGGAVSRGEAVTPVAQHSRSQHDSAVSRRQCWEGSRSAPTMIKPGLHQCGPPHHFKAHTEPTSTRSHAASCHATPPSSHQAAPRDACTPHPLAITQPQPHAASQPRHAPPLLSLPHGCVAGPKTQPRKTPQDRPVHSPHTVQAVETTNCSARSSPPKAPPGSRAGRSQSSRRKCGR